MLGACPLGHQVGRAAQNERRAQTDVPAPGSLWPRQSSFKGRACLLGLWDLTGSLFCLANSPVGLLWSLGSELGATCHPLCCRRAAHLGRPWLRRWRPGPPSSHRKRTAADEQLICPSARRANQEQEAGAHRELAPTDCVRRNLIKGAPRPNERFSLPLGAPHSRPPAAGLEPAEIGGERRAN